MWDVITSTASPWRGASRTVAPGSPVTASRRGGWSDEDRTRDCYFVAPTAGHYICTAALQSYPTGSGAQVECLIDNSSFGPLPFSGTIPQPHPCDLSAGGHHFRIRQMSGSFFFLSLTVWKV